MKADGEFQAPLNVNWRSVKTLDEYVNSIVIAIESETVMRIETVDPEKI